MNLALMGPCAFIRRGSLLSLSLYWLILPSVLQSFRNFKTVRLFAKRYDETFFLIPWQSGLDSAFSVFKWIWLYYVLMLRLRESENGYTSIQGQYVANRDKTWKNSPHSLILSAMADLTILHPWMLYCNLLEHWHRACPSIASSSDIYLGFIQVQLRPCFYGKPEVQSCLASLFSFES